MGVRDTSLETFTQIRERLPEACRPVLEVLWELGPMHNNRILEALNQREAATCKPKDQKRHWQINQVAGRVNDLVHKYGVVRDLGRHIGQWKGKAASYHFWRVAGDTREPVGFIKAENEPPYDPKQGHNTAQRHHNRQTAAQTTNHTPGAGLGPQNRPQAVKREFKKELKTGQFLLFA